MCQKPDKISGRLLGVSRNGAEIEGHGTIPFSEDLQCYRLYGRLSQMDIGELKIGYGFTDFVVEDGTIEAALAVREEKMETIRVLIKTSGYANSIHQAVELFADCDCRILNVESELATLEKNQHLVITRDSPLFDQTGRITIEPKILTGHLMLSGVERAQGQANYRGRLELVRREDGILVINELPLEEYLYGVVPSEMPASYPLEALKSQAVCARTYAYEKLQRAGLPEYGAHVDDSTAFQVYQNLAEEAQTTQAVKETAGQVLFYGEEPAQTYYYSTSYGHTGDYEAWNLDKDAYGYLQGVWVRSEENPIDLSDEKSFLDYISNVDSACYESDLKYFRWNTVLDFQGKDETLLHTIADRKEHQPEAISYYKDASKTEKTDSCSNFGSLQAIKVVKRNQSGVILELELDFQNGAVSVQSEYNMRAILGCGITNISLLDGSSVEMSILPSAYISIQAKGDGTYAVLGGGYGHGIGMSQNGAQKLCGQGFDYKRILNYFYQDTELTELYQPQNVTKEEGGA